MREEIIAKENYGNDLEIIAQSVTDILERSCMDEDGLVYAALNGLTNEPYSDADPDFDYPIEKLWCANGAFPYHLKRTFINYEDSCMTMAELLLAYLTRAQVAPTSDHISSVDQLGELMISIPEEVGRVNPYGFGFLPKLHGGMKHLHECFEFSADQLLKWMYALDAYREFTREPDRQQRIDSILLATARWLDARDFVTPYMGYPNYARLNHLRHYHACFAYLCARGYRLSGDQHLLHETRFFRDRMLDHSHDSTSANSMNLVFEGLSSLCDLIPDDRKAWLSLMRRDWAARVNYYLQDGSAHGSDYLWNVGTRMATNYLVAKKLLPEIEGDFDIREVLLSHNHKGCFYHLVRGQEIKINEEDGGIHTYRNMILVLAYASWLRAYWMWKSTMD